MVETAVSTNQKPTMYRNLYENTGPESQHKTNRDLTWHIGLRAEIRQRNSEVVGNNCKRQSDDKRETKYSAGIITRTNVSVRCIERKHDSLCLWCEIKAGEYPRFTVK